MDTFLSTSAERSAGGAAPARRLLLLAALFFSGVSLLRAGTVITLTNGSEGDGKLSLTAAAVHVDGPSAPPDVALTDVLESNFSDDPFQLTIFYAGKGTQLPPNWKAQQIGEVDVPGTVNAQDGTFTISGGSSTQKKPAGNEKPASNGAGECLFFAGQPWTDDGDFTARLKEWDTQIPERSAGLMLRDSLDPGAIMCALELLPQGIIRLPFRKEHGKPAWGGNSSGDVPLWMRFTRRNDTLYASIATNGSDWDILEEASLKSLPNPLAGLFVSSHKDKGACKAVFDQVSVTPLPSSAQVLPAGVLLQGGSLLVGRFARLSFDPANSDENGDLVRGLARTSVPRSLVAGVLFLPTDRSRLAQMASKPGVLMRNGDVMDGDVNAISNEEISISSVLLGITNYKAVEVRGCFIKPLQAQPAAFEVRLKDGSILYVTTINGDASEVLLTDVSGLTIRVDAADVAQVRAGPSVTQDLAQLDWKATPPAGNAATATNAAPANPAPAANPADAAAGNNGAPAAPAPPPPPPLVQSWLGKSQEQIMETDIGTAIEFPLPGKFRAMGVQVALSSDSPANATTTIHILADGREIAKSPPFRAGDPPRFMEVTLQNATHVTLQADSIYPGTKVLYLDPVAIRN